jgi:hypothetical protein
MDFFLNDSVHSNLSYSIQDAKYNFWNNSKKNSFNIYNLGSKLLTLKR